MLGLPKSTELNKRIPKQKFYENLDVTPAIRREISQGIKVIYWRNKIAATTINVAKGEIVDEIEIIEIQLRDSSLSEKVLKQIDREIAYHILFLLEYEGKYQAWIGYKEEAAGNKAFKVNRYYHTDWEDIDNLGLRLEGLSTDGIYDNFVRQIAKGELLHSDNESLKESFDRSKKKETIELQVKRLEDKIRKEKQLNRQVVLREEIKKLQKELEEV